MSKQNKKSEGKGKGNEKKVVVAVAGADDDFDDMLAELRAADITADVATSTSTSSSASSTSSSSSSSTSTSSSNSFNRASAAKADEVSEEALMQACVRGEVSQLRCWARRGVRVTSAEPLCDAVGHGKVEVVQCLTRELGGDVNQADENGFSPLYITSLIGNVTMVKCLVNELGADINQAGA
jgi:ankyrin repeat protein